MNVCKRQGILLLLLGASLGFGLGGCSDESSDAVAVTPAASGMKAAPRVQVVTVGLSRPEWEQTYPGRVESVRSVSIRPRVSGMLDERLYEEGQSVVVGDALFSLDKEPFQIELDRARAELERAQAASRQAEREWERTRRLFDDSALSERQRDDALAARELAEATLASARASVRQAELDLEYATVRSPIRGVTRVERLPPGSLVTPQDELTVVTQIDPIYVSFSLPIGDPAYQQIMASENRGKPVGKVSLFRRDGRVFEHTGEVNYTASEIDPQTGTVQARAVFPNPEGELLPGEFARVAFSGLKLPESAIVPEKSVLSSPQGNLVYVVGSAGIVQPRPVTLGPLLEEGQTIRSGLKQGDRVVTTSLIRIRPGMPVEAVEVDKPGE